MGEMSVINANIPGPRVRDDLIREIGGDWTGCLGCPALRVHDGHYFYCRRLADQERPEEWPYGWFRLWKTTFDVAGGQHAPCKLPTIRGHDEDEDEEGSSAITGVDLSVPERDGAVSILPESDIPDWDDLRGRAPDATGGLSSEAFVRELRDGWR